MTDTATEVVPTRTEAPSDPVQQVYYGTDETYPVYFDDDFTFVTCKSLEEGDRKRYQAAINKDVHMNRQTGDVRMQLSAGEERHALIIAAVVGWNLIDRDRNPIPFSKKDKDARGPGTLEQWLEHAPPRMVDRIEKAIRKHESWTLGDMSVSDIDEQIETLQEMRETLLKEEEGKES